MPSLRWRIVSAIEISRLRASTGANVSSVAANWMIAKYSRCAWNHSSDGADAELDAAHRVGFVADRLLLALAQIVVRRLEQLGEELVLRREVPVEDALADAERGDDVGDRGGVVAPLGEQPGRAGDQLLPALLTSGRELAAHDLRSRRSG